MPHAAALAMVGPLGTLEEVSAFIFRAAISKNETTLGG
jgi:hypothetical protein